MKQIFTFQDIYYAYRKMKNYYYYDNTSLLTRYRIAEYEKNLQVQDLESFKEAFKNKTEDLLKILNDDNKLFKKYLNNIKFSLYPKKIKKIQDDKNEGSIVFLSNYVSNESITIEKYNIIIDAPIEIYLISTLWVMCVGKLFGKLYNEHNYAHIFNSNIENNQHVDGSVLDDDLQLFKPYFSGYQEWRDKALEQVEHLLDSQRNATVINLDIERFFYNVKVNIPDLFSKYILDGDIKIDADIQKKAERLNELLQAIHEHYTTLTSNYVKSREGLPDCIGNETLLPVGLISSGVIGNIYLHDFDEYVMNDLRPSYYGRYVDDMLFVLSDLRSDIQAEHVIDDYFDKKSQLFLQRESMYFMRVHNELRIQKEKIVVQHFVWSESRAALKTFKENISHQRSEFRFLPDEDFVSKEFDVSAYSMQYSGSINKLWSIKDIKENKYGASIFLANIIFLARCELESKEQFEKIDGQQILTFFKEDISIDFFSLWEKVATYFILKNDIKSVLQFKKQVELAISKINANTLDEADKIKKCLFDELELSIAMPLSMNLSYSKAFSNTIEKKAESFRKSSLFRHHYIGIHGLDITKCVCDMNMNLFNPKLNECDLELNVNICVLSPLFIRFDDINSILIFQIANKYDFQSTINEKYSNLVKTALELYSKINYAWKTIFINKQPKHYEDCVSMKILDGVCFNNSNSYYCSISTRANNISINKTIAIANINVDENLIQNIANGGSTFTQLYKHDLFKIINDAIENHCNMLILPELSVPYQWLDILIDKSRKYNLAIVTGLQYYINKQNCAFNIVVSILPVKTDSLLYCAVIPRVKNHYAPKEIQELSLYRYKIPINPNEKNIYHLFHWQKSYFSVYNCYELASIEDRSLFKSKVDFIIATELNKDINYYSEIAGSWTRDIHCFIIQVNTSSRGDSRSISRIYRIGRKRIV